MEYAITGTKQEIFDRVCAHLRKQGACASRTSFGYRWNVQCMYLTDDGRKCAIGALIPDGHPAQSSDLTVYDLAQVFYDLIDPELRRDYFLSDLQRVHDNQSSQDRPDFEPGLKELAFTHGLIYTPPA